MLTGLKLGLSGCSPPSFFFARVSSQVISISYCACILWFLLSHVFYDFFTFSQLRMSHLAGHGRCLIMLFAMLLWLQGVKR
jgi:hypothetical protein